MTCGPGTRDGVYKFPNEGTRLAQGVQWFMRARTLGADR